MTRVTSRDGINAGMCIKGQARFFRHHELDFKSFVRSGAPVEYFKSIKDGNLDRVIEVARLREEAEHNGR